MLALAGCGDESLAGCQAGHRSTLVDFDDRTAGSGPGDRPVGQLVAGSIARCRRQLERFTHLDRRILRRDHDRRDRDTQDAENAKAADRSADRVASRIAAAPGDLLPRRVSDGMKTDLALADAGWQAR